MSTTTKLRVVFDGSAKTTSGLSLNDIQDIGSPVQDDLFSILLRFRHHSVVLSADISKMYRQILVKPNERAMQRILWRPEPNMPIRTYELNTVTYGTASAPFLATRCLHEIGKLHKMIYPIASEIIQRDFYVDDLLSGAETIEAATALKSNLNEILKSAGMELRKWASNESRVIHGNTKSTEPVIISGDKDPKTLGIFWDPRTDTLHYQINRDNFPKITKRSILSIISQIFDPLGLVGPSIIQAKVIMQKLWALNLNWDESLPQELHSSWLDIYNNIAEINSLVINRHIKSPACGDVEYHGFCDASELAYGACIYVCSTNSKGIRNVHLLCAKSRVAPLKAMTMPRLELMGALLLAQLAHKVSRACDVPRDKWHYWTDSMVTLAWIKACSSRWKTFIANRTAEIQELTNGNWNHVVSKQNPADLISRGVNAIELRESNLWWHGPHWLSQCQSSWPLRPTTNIDNAPEQRISTLIIKKKDETCDLFKRFSSFTKLIRVTVYIFRFFNECKKSIKKCEANSNTEPGEPYICTAEFQEATNRLIKQAQYEEFPKELSQLQKGQQVNRDSRIAALNPFIDTSGLLRVGGRLRHAELLSFDQRHPIILSSNHPLTNLIIKNEHARLLHAGCQSIMASLRQKYWPLNCKNSVKRVIKECVTCFRIRPTHATYMMGNLPSTRVVPVRAFYNCGVDYAGPFLIKERGRTRTSIKAYICIFVCFASKAVHIELATDLSTNAFLNCLKRFISRRGLCKNIYSDNGSNFVGSKTELEELRSLVHQENFKNEITNFSVAHNINWHFIPPHAPHFGGLWESAVKSAKFHLKRVIGETRLTYEELYTLLTQIEACMNSRPLFPLSDDPNDLTPLTPGHFLIGDSLKTLPQEDVRTINVNRLNRYQHLQQMVQHFWRRWHQEYLPQLQGRQKWKFSNQEVLKRHTMVLIRDDNVPPMQWPLGRITELHPGSDGITRVVSIQTARGIVKRPVAKICILPIEKDITDSQD